MIKRITIEGFQSHENTVVDLVNGLNILTGSSDSGKTAVLRAVKWVALNVPTGDSYVNQKVGYAKVTIETDKGTVTKTRKGKKTAYEVNGTVYEKSEVPQEVSEILGIEPTTFGDYEVVLNVASQLESPFLLSESPSTGAKVLGKLANAETVDVAIKTNAKETFQLNSERQRAEKEVSRLTEALTAYYNLDEIEETLKCCKSCVEEIEKQKTDLANLQQIRVTYAAVSSQLAYIKGVLDKYSDLQAVESRLNIVNEDFVRVSRLRKLKSDYLSTNTALLTAKGIIETSRCLAESAKALEGIEQRISTFNKLTALSVKRASASDTIKTLHETLEKVKGVREAEALIVKVEESYSKWQTLYDLHHRYTEADFKLGCKTRTVDEARSEVARAEFALTEAWKSLEVCPLCERSIGGKNENN